MDWDRLFISKLLDSSIEEIRQSFRVVPIELVQGNERSIYNFVRNYYRESKGKIPSYAVVKNKFPEFKKLKVTDTIGFISSELKRRKKYEILTESSTTINQKLFMKDVEAAEKEVGILRTRLSELYLMDSQSALGNFAERKRSYIAAKKNKGIIGLQTQISVIDKHIGGIQNEMIVVIGRRGLGKTFLGLMIMDNVWDQLEGPAVIVSNEMTTEQVLKRVDSIVARVNYSKYRKGLLSPLEEKRIAALKNIYSNRHHLEVIPGAGKSVAELEMEIMSFEPAFLLVDGLYLTNEGFMDPFKNTLAASRGYQRFIKKYKIPTVLTSQENKEGEAKYAGAVEEDADIVIRMKQPPALKTDKLMKLEFTKIREEDWDISAYLNWNFDKWDFSECDLDTPDITAEKVYE